MLIRGLLTFREDRVVMRNLRVLRWGFVVAWVVGSGGIARADYPAAVTALGPNHYYRLDETAVGTVTDIGTSRTNGAHAGDFGATGGVLGVQGVTLPGFSGENKALWANDAGAVNLGASGSFGQATMTVALWFKNPTPTGTGVSSDRLFQNNTTAAPLIIAASSSLDGTIHVATGTLPGDGLQLSPSKLWLLNNAWHHLVVVRNGDRAANLKVYVDGKDRTGLFSGAPFSWTTTGDRAWIAAADASQHLGLSNATVDEVAIWNNRALSGNDVRGLYDAAIGPAPTYSGYAGAVLDTNPIAYYRLQEDAGLVAGDAVRNWVHGDSQTTTLGVGTAGYSQAYPNTVPTFAVPGAGPTTRIAGEWLGGLDAGNRAAAFSGNSIDDVDMIHVGGNPAWFTEEKTYSLLFKTDAHDRYMRLVASDPGSEDDFDLIMDEGRLVLVGQRDPGVATVTTETYYDDQWHHVVAVRAGDLWTDLRLFVDGEQVTLNEAAVPVWAAPTSGRIGARSDNAGGFCGLLDEIAIWDRALSNEQSRALFDSLVGGAPPPVPGDANGDWLVNDTDASIVAVHWGQRGGAHWEDGDFNGDHDVSDADAAILAAHWGAGEGTDAAAPEPSVGLLLLVMSPFVLGAWIRRRAVVGCRLSVAGGKLSAKQ
jgi:hypothetical protein